jgi:hypothetical protein
MNSAPCSNQLGLQNIGQVGSLLETLAPPISSGLLQIERPQPGKSSQAARNAAYSPAAGSPLPMTPEESRARGWDEVDVVIITGDAYIDHPSFAMAILGRVLEAAGFAWGLSPSPIGAPPTPGGGSAALGCSSRLARGTWIR